jgi:5'-phosphate synthase pdxT subunit
VKGPVGVLALQGDFAAHQALLEGVGVPTQQVRGPEDLAGLKGLLLPGGESTTIAMGIDREGLSGPIRDFAESGLPVFGTCAGMVLMGNQHLGLIDIEVDRNAFGRQIKSFETDLPLDEAGDPPIRAVFIRAPVVRSYGPGVEVLAMLDERVVAVRQGSRTAISFHPELVHDPRMHLLALGLSSEPSEPALADT